jgi:hypothetical protein
MRLLGRDYKNTPKICENVFSRSWIRFREDYKPPERTRCIFPYQQTGTGRIKQVALGDKLAFNIVQDAKSGRHKAADICFADDVGAA